MRTTVDLNDALYRALKAKAAREGRTVRELLTDAVERLLQPERQPPAVLREPTPRPYFGALAEYADRVESHDPADIRASVAKARDADAG
jgi:hypothetical protein